LKSEIRFSWSKKTIDGVNLGTAINVDLPEGKSFDGTGFAGFRVKDVGNVHIALATKDVQDCSVQISRRLASGPFVSAHVTGKPEVTLRGSYEKENVAANASLTASENTAAGTVAVAGGLDGIAVGAQGDFDVHPEAKLTQIDAGFSYRKGQLLVAGSSRNELLREQRVDTTSIGGLYDYDKRTKLGGLLLFRIAEGFPQDKRWLYATAQHQLDESTSVKGKVELLKDRDVTFSVTHSLKSPQLRFGFSTVFDPVAAFKNKGFKFTATFGDF